MSSNIVTGNVTSYLQSVFHPEWSFSSTSGFMFQLDTSLMGNVDIGDLSTNYTLKLNGIEIAASGQGVASLNSLTGGLTISTNTITNISIGTDGFSNIFIDFSGTAGGGGTAGVSSVNNITGAVTLLSGNGINIIQNNSELTFSVTAGGIADVCDWAQYFAISNIDLSGQTIYDSSADRAITLSGNVVVQQGLTVMENIVSACGNLTVATGNLLMASGNVTATSAAFSQNVAVGGNISITGDLSATGQAYINTLPQYYPTYFTSNVGGASNLQTICDIIIDTSHVYRFSVGNWIAPNVTLSRYSLFLSLSTAGGGHPEFPIVDRYNLVTGPSLDGATISGYYTEYSTVFNTSGSSYSNVQLNAILGVSDPNTYMAFGNIAIERLR